MSDNKPDEKLKGFALLTPEERAQLGRKGGKHKVRKGFATLSKEELSEISRKAANKRWGNKQDVVEPADAVEPADKQD